MLTTEHNNMLMFGDGMVAVSVCRRFTGTVSHYVQSNEPQPVRRSYEFSTVIVFEVISPILAPFERVR